MRRFNLLYIVALIALVFLWKMNLNNKEQTVIFYGFAENKETEINLEHAVKVDQIFVTTGQRVKKGIPLIEVSHNKLPLKINELTFEKQETEVDRLLWKEDIRASIEELKAKRATKVSAINVQIVQIEAKVAQNQALVKDLKTVEVTGTNGQSEATKAKIAGLQQELKTVVLPYDVEIQRLEKKLNNKNSPYQIKLNKLKSEQEFYEDKGRKLDIVAPTDGVIGNIHCKEAENISSFNTLITFYEENPTLVKGYVHENMLIHVKTGDTLTVSSSTHPKTTCKGVVTGLGSRVIEIPSRLRKYSELKTYGREVLIRIPANNDFLQKEKVILNLGIAIKSSLKFFDFVFGTSKE